ncbi:unnamed protein product [Rotaria magnacalcarata]
MFDRVKRERDKIKENHKRKLEKLNKGPIGQNYETTRNKLVHNISTYVLTPAEERLLCRGWNFCIESKITKTDDFKTDMEINATKLESHCHPSVFSTIYHHLHDYANKYIRNINKNNIRNISDEEFHAIKTLRNNKEIIISRADKGNAIVVMDKKDYIEKTNNILQLKQFQHTTKSLQKEKEEEMNKYLRELYKENTITKELFYSIRSTCSSIACMYGQPKIHKNGYPLRPIISSIGSYNYELSKYLAGLIKANRVNKSFSYIKDSFDLVKQIKEITNAKQQVMCSFDVDALYTNVPVKEAIDIVVESMEKSKTIKNTPFNKKQFKKLLELAVCNVPFRFMNEYYIQCDGVAMGSPLGPILADMFMSKLENKLNKFSKNKPQVWLRYVDDILCIFDNKQNIDNVLESINKWHKNISFTREKEIDNTIHFLDVLIIRNINTNKYDTTIYKKPTNTNLYLLYESNQPRKYKLGLIRTQTIRILLLCSSDRYSNQELIDLEKTLGENGYPKHIIRRGIREGKIITTKIINKHKNNNNNNNNNNSTSIKKKIFFTLTYYGHESNILVSRIQKLCKRFLPHLEINITLKNTNTLKNTFLSIQKGVDEENKLKKLVYQIPCKKNCNYSYIGETNRSLTTRIKEHKEDIRKAKENSNTAQHVFEKNHSFDFDNTRILSSEINWKRRVIKESLFTHYSYGKSLNEVKHKLKIFA